MSMKDELLNLLGRLGREHVSRRELAERLDAGADDRKEFRAALRELEADGVLIRVKKNYYAVRGRARLVTGKLQCHRSGFGFVIPDPECHPGGDVYVRAADLGDATHGDRVAVQLLDARPGAAPEPPRPGRSGPRLEGRILHVLERGTPRIIGRILFLKKPVVIPLDPRFHYTVHPTNTDAFELADGDIVAVSLTTEPSTHTRPDGRIVALVGKPDDPELPYKIALSQHDIPTEFSPEALAEARRAPREITAAELAGRADLRPLPAVTIDGETAFDFDDAVNAARRADGDYTLWVHIADVSHFVPPDGAVDREAFRRGTSVYFPDRAIPMLPEDLSSDACSLLPDQDRLTFTAELTIDGRTGRTTAARFMPSVIRSRARMTYTQVAAILDGDAAARAQHPELAVECDGMAELARLLNTRRRQRGAIDFDLPQEEVRYDPAGAVVGIFKSERTFAHRLIEEFMLAANEAVAAHFQARELPFIYRIHEPPDALRVQELAETAACFGYDFELDPEAYTPRDFQGLADRFEDSPVGQYLSYVMLRTFKLAVYSERNSGHFGLAADTYTHFTSPIRRYPDLMVHRLLRHALAHPDQPTPPGYDIAALHEIAGRASEREREAVEAEREVLAWKKAEFMQQHVGGEFEGFVSGLRPSGLNVQLTRFFIEGFVSLSSLTDDFYVFDERRHLFYGERGGRVFALGTPVTVRVDRVDMVRYQTEFSVVGGGGAASDAPRSRSRRPARGATGPQPAKSRSAPRRAPAKEARPRVKTHRAQPPSRRDGNSRGRGRGRRPR